MAAKDLITSGGAGSVRLLVGQRSDRPLGRPDHGLLGRHREILQASNSLAFLRRALQRLRRQTAAPAPVPDPERAIRAYMPVFVCRVQNTNTALNQQARVSITSTGLQCWRSSKRRRLHGNAPHLGILPHPHQPHERREALATAGRATWYPVRPQNSPGTTAIGRPAICIVPNSYGDPLEGTGIQTSQGNLNARGAFAALLMHTYELQGYQWDGGAGCCARFPTPIRSCCIPKTSSGLWE